MKVRGLKWIKTKLEDWNEIWKNLESQFFISANIIIKMILKLKRRMDTALINFCLGEEEEPQPSGVE